jgi:hypothetical protein
MADVPPMPATGSTKRCPSCAEEVRSEAVVCRYCSYNFQTMSRDAAALVPVKTNGYAIASLVLGILWIYSIGSILALVFGYLAKGRIDASGGRESGRGMAVAGIVLGWIGVGLTLLAILLIAVSSPTVVS